MASTTKKVNVVNEDAGSSKQDKPDGDVPKVVSNEGVEEVKKKKRKRITGVRSGGIGWVDIGGCTLPYVVRIANNERLRFISVHHAQVILLKPYLQSVHSSVIKACTAIKGYHITGVEATLLTAICERRRCCSATEWRVFRPGVDLVATVEDVSRFYDFLRVCNNKLRSAGVPIDMDVCGFVYTAAGVSVPYVMIDGKRHVPCFFIEADHPERLLDMAVKVRRWHLAYLKFCCMALGVRKELYAGDTCLMVDVDSLRASFPTCITSFECYWPIKLKCRHRSADSTERIQPWVKKPAKLLLPPPPRRPALSTSSSATATVTTAAAATVTTAAAATVTTAAAATVTTAAATTATTAVQQQTTVTSRQPILAQTVTNSAVVPNNGQDGRPDVSAQPTSVSVD